ncbi:MAG: PBP1A family penicillin-binding protein [Deltaproteobacteria bacterium]|nr:PBP1A family penicillin-binding protein [Deltaproteobacteria bacterium]
MHIARGLPSVQSLVDYHPNLATRIYASDGSPIAEFFTERRIVVPLGKIPDHVIKAFLAAEDARFFEHKGLDYTGILRAFVKNMLAGKVVQGGSTITQQVVKGFFLSSEKTLDRKLREAILAFRIEKNLSKDEILHLYLNQIYLGNGAYGLEAAAQSYFGKDVEELDLSEGSLLAGLPKAPSRYSPYNNIQAAKERQRFVLDQMIEEKMITKEDADKTFNKPFKLKPRRAETLWSGPYFTEHVRRHIEEKYGEDLLYKGGLHVYTTMDIEMQRAANEAIGYGLEAHDRRRGFRGPLYTLKSKDEQESFKEETDKELKKRPLEPGLKFKAMVVSLNAKEKTATVSIGSKKGVIPALDLNWARLYNPADTPEGGRLAELNDIFHAGDVIEVSVVSVNPRGYVLLGLAQEPKAQAAFIAMEPETGFVRAMVGGADFSKSSFNRAIQAKRQPGSAFKPIIYAAAIDKGYTPATIVMDSPIVFEGAMDEDWKPKNFEEKFHGPTTIREALTKSRNVVTIKVLKDIGIDSAISSARKLGITSPIERNLSLALGSSSVSLLELTRAFAVFANRGQRTEPIFITRITDSKGAILEENLVRSEKVLSPETAYIMTSLMEGVVQRGTAWRAKAIGRPSAGKTGTTSDLNDGWYIGYVPGLVAGAWVGYDDLRPLGKLEVGGRAALPIWVEFMKKAIVNIEQKEFEAPEGVEFASIDQATGLLAGPETKTPVFEVFKQGTAPTEVSTRKAAVRTDDFFSIDAKGAGDQ